MVEPMKVPHGRRAGVPKLAVIHSGGGHTSGTLRLAASAAIRDAIVPASNVYLEYQPDKESLILRPAPDLAAISRFTAQRFIAASDLIATIGLKLNDQLTDIEISEDGQIEVFLRNGRKY